MSRDMVSVADETLQDSTTSSKKRKVEQAELEVDLNAPEPPSKKALRKAKRSKEDRSQEPITSIALSSNKASGESRLTKEEVNNSGKRSDYGIWIGNLSFTTTREDLFDFMSSDTEHVIPKEKVTRINLPAGRSRNGQPQNKGFAYVDLADARAHANALELSEKLLAGRRVLIKDAKSFEGRPAAGAQDEKRHPPSKRIFVGNLGFDTTVEQLEEHFSPCGPISNTHMATFEDSGKCKGYAWIEFEQLASGQAAMRGWLEEGGQQDSKDVGVQRSKRRIWLHNLEGRKLRLEFAEDKATRYQKRYGKDAKKGEQNEDIVEDVGGSPSADKPSVVAGVISSRPRTDHRDHKNKKTQVRKNGYAETTVRRLTGAIVEGEGNKVTFS